MPPGYLLVPAKYGQTKTKGGKAKLTTEEATARKTTPTPTPTHTQNMSAHQQIKENSDKVEKTGKDETGYGVKS